jgi:hypothetical protein
VGQTAALTALPYGDRALPVEIADLAEVAAVRAALEGAPLPGQRDEEPFVDVAPVRAPSSAPVLRALPGPRRDWLTRQRGRR